MLSSINETKNKTKSKKQRDLSRWIRKHISRVYGRLLGCPKPLMLKEQYIEHFGLGRCKREFITHNAIFNHWNEPHLSTLYFYGNEFGSSQLVMLDIDVGKSKGKGSTKGAIECAEFLRDNYFSNLYFEPSTNGRGIHGYFVLERSKATPAQANLKLKELEKALKIACAKFDIELIEVKGHAIEIEWRGQNLRGVKNMKYGQLAKLPRDWERLDELKATTHIELVGLDGICKALASRPAGVGREVGTVSVATLPHSPTPPKKSKQEGGRSNVGGLIKPSSRVVYVAKKLYRNHKMVASHNGTRVTRKHLIYFLTLLEFFHKNPKPDHSLPKIRFKNLWNSLHESGTFDCKWHENIDKACRDYLSSLGLLNWLENKWVAPRKFVNKNGEEIVIRGQCCRWCMGQKLNSMLTSYPLNC